MPKWLERMAGREARQAGLKPGSKRFKAYKYTVIRKAEHKEKEKK